MTGSDSRNQHDPFPNGGRPSFGQWLLILVIAFAAIIIGGLLELRDRAWRRWKQNGEKQLEILAGVEDE